jgi:hypothetical protein
MARGAFVSTITLKASSTTSASSIVAAPRLTLRLGTPLWLDGLIALLLFIGAATGGLSYWKHIVAAGQPFYYQNYFEPAVMIGCGKGFVVARPQVPAMVPFLWRQADHFSCDAIAPDAPLGTEDMFQQGSWRYLMLAVGFTWRLFGVSWSALGPLFAAFFGATIAAVYAVFRLGMTPALAVAGALVLRFSDLHLKYFPVLRDYTKAPFTLALIFLLGLLVTRRATRKGALSIAAAYGAVAGIGYGFRTDFIAYLPPLFVALFAFLDGGTLRNMRLKLATGALCMATFIVAASPVLSSLDKSRSGCQWHVVLLGLAKQFAAPLGVETAPYEVAREYLDEFAYTTVTSYAARVQPRIGHIEYCEAGYGRATRAYLWDVIKRFPADVIVRAYASVLRIVELPFAERPDRDDSADTPPARDARHVRGLALVAAAIVTATVRDRRVGIFLLFFLLYFGGLPSIQFDARHYFYLEFVTWWAAGFLVQAAVDQVRPAMGTDRWRADARSVARAALTLAVCFVLLAAMLWAARWYQQTAARSLLAAYLAAPRSELSVRASPDESELPVRASPHTDPETADFVVVDLNPSRCGEHATVAFRYDERTRRAYSRVFEVPRGDGSGLTHIFMPIYDGFRRLEFDDSARGCIEGVYRVREPERFPLLLEVVLPPGWRRMPLYQRLRSF